jgi:excisionase family DNA binding protein
LDCDEETIRRAIRSGALRAMKLGRTYRVTKPWLLQWLGAKLEGPWARPADWRAPDAVPDVIPAKAAGSKAVN